MPALRFLEELSRYTDQLDERERKVVAPLYSIDGTKIDEVRSGIEETTDFIKIDLVSEGDVSFPLSIWIGKIYHRHKVFLLFGGDIDERKIPIISYGDISSSEGLYDTESTVCSVLISYVFKKDVISKGELVKRIIKSSAFQFGDGEMIPFSRSFKRIWRQRQEETSEAEYQPWLAEAASASTVAV